MSVFLRTDSGFASSFHFSVPYSSFSLSLLLSNPYWEILATSHWFVSLFFHTTGPNFRNFHKNHPLSAGTAPFKFSIRSSPFPILLLPPRSCWLCYRPFSIPFVVCTTVCEFLLVKLNVFPSIKDHWASLEFFKVPKTWLEHRLQQTHFQSILMAVFKLLWVNSKIKLHYFLSIL